MFHRLSSSAFLSILLTSQGFSQHEALIVPSVEVHTWHANHVKHLIGFERASRNSEGDLTITSEALVFHASHSAMQVPRDQITALFVGNERVETGGFAGKAARIAIPYGGGAVLGTMTQKQVGLLTVEYRDTQKGLHTAVFQLPKNEAQEAQTSMTAAAVSPRPADTRIACRPGSPVVGLELTQVGLGEGTVIPSEFEAVLYESMISTLHEKAKDLSIYRDGDRSGACQTGMAVLTIENFSKGNAAVRASTGPLGLWVGVTRLRANLRVFNADGIVLLNEELKASRRGDRESLDAAKSIGKDAGKRLASMSKATASKSRGIS